MFQSVRILAAVSFLVILLAGGILEATAMGCSYWLHGAVEAAAEGAGDCSNKACRCPEGQCRGGSRCGCGATGATGILVIQRWRIPCHDPIPSPGVFQPSPAMPALITVTGETVGLPWLTAIPGTVYRLTLVSHSSPPPLPPPRPAV